MLAYNQDYALNAICPYFTMFPLEFPLNVLRKRALKGQVVLDPFCGRGTTNYASRVLGLASIGIDGSPVAVAISEAKLVSTSPERIVQIARRILGEAQPANNIPTGEFWEWAFDRNVLNSICVLREELLRNCESDTRKALRAILIGALHGPQGKTQVSYLSNQAQRTYAPKPGYAVKFWKREGLRPRYVDVLKVIEERALRYYSNQPKFVAGKVILGDSRNAQIFRDITADLLADWIITSPPYYGMRTYIPDQWLRSWFIGGPACVDYAPSSEQMIHSAPSAFAAQLKEVWTNAGAIAKPGARLVIRFGGIRSRNVNPISILRESLADTGWRIETIKSAGSASRGRRQALHISLDSKEPVDESDLWARWIG